LNKIAGIGLHLGLLLGLLFTLVLFAFLLQLGPASDFEEVEK
jgi:hypothetical protein